MTDFQREERFIVVKRKHLTPAQESELRNFLAENEIPTVESVVLESDKPYYEAGWKLVENNIKNNCNDYDDVVQFIGTRVKPRLNLHKSNCELRDERWSIEINSTDEPCFVS